jgi:hypothetical protein
VSAQAPNVYPILATPFGVVPLPDVQRRNEALLALFTEHATRNGAAAQADSLLYQGRDDLLEWPQPEVKAATHAMLQGIVAVARSVSTLPGETFQSLTMQARAWFTIVRPDGAMPGRIYPLTAWCGVYCVAAPAPSPVRRDSGALRLYESRFGTMFADATNSTLAQPFSPGHSAWTPVPGSMAVFPASVLHEVALLKAATPLVLVMLRARFVAPGQEGWATW